MKFSFEKVKGGLTMGYVYVKDSDGFVVKKLENECLPNEVIISEQEYNELSGENYYKEHFTHGGARVGAGRKPKTGVVLKFQIRVSEKEKALIKYIRDNHINVDELMQN